MHQIQEPFKRLKAAQILALVLLGIVVLMLAWMNNTLGHFGFPDEDGCACYVSYTTQLADPACEVTRPIHCEQLLLSRMISYLSYLDFNP
jgi:hypothetical protein